LAGAARTPPLDKAGYFEHPHTVIEGDCDHVTGPHHAARRIDPRPVDPDIAAARQRRRGIAGAYNTGMPEPAIDALPVSLARHSAALLGIGLKLRLQRRELGKG
jgi:hypothetical protein